MDRGLQAYAEFTAPEDIDDLRALAGRISGQRLQHVTSEAVGGSVADSLTRLLPLLRELGVEASWDVIRGDEAFCQAVRAIHTAMRGAPNGITGELMEVFESAAGRYRRETPVTGDIVVVHDAAPLGLVERKREIDRRWLWHCHRDISQARPSPFSFLDGYIGQYDAAAFPAPEFARHLPIPRYVTPPTIDPLSERNKELPAGASDGVLEQYGVDPGRPVLTQVSPFTHLKDPLAPISSYRMVKRRQDCQLVLAGPGASETPAEASALPRLLAQADTDPDIHVLPLPAFRELEINAIVRGSTIVLQQSLREGYPLTVSEAMWKRKPVIGAAVGGIKAQLFNGVTGFLVHSPEGAAARTQQLLADADLRRKMGENGRAHVRRNFLLTRQLRDWLLMAIALDQPRPDYSPASKRGP